MGRLRVGLNRNAVGRDAGHQCLLSLTESERPTRGACIRHCAIFCGRSTWGPLESGTGLSARMRHFDRRLVRTVHAGARIERLAGRKKDDARVGKAAALGGEIDGCSGTRGGREELAGSEAAAGTRQRYRQKALYTTLEVDWGSDQSGQQGGASLKESSGW